MMWDFSGGNRKDIHPSPIQMPNPSFPVPQRDGLGPNPFIPSSYPPAPGFGPPAYFSRPAFERTMYYGDAPPPLHQLPPSHSYSHLYDQQLQPEPRGRPRANSHSHLHSHSHSHSHSHHPPRAHSKPPSRPSSAKPPTPTPKPSAPHKSSGNKIHQSQSIPQLTLNPNFQYSKCTGRKKALCIGINYKGQPNELRGCVNDARHVRDFLTKSHGYRSGDIVLLTDDSKNPRQQPTKQNILDAMHWLVRSARKNDSLFFHYSGHGGQTKDLNGDEVDGWDEVIFPVDFRKAGHIIDDQMHDIMVKPLPPGCRLTALFDSCHSGTVLDLPYIYSSHGRLKGTHVSDRMRRQLTTTSDVISWSGCKDGQTSADTFAGGVAVGAMSYAFITALTRNPKQTYQELLKSLRLILHPRFSQKPQLGSSHHIVCFQAIDRLVKLLTRDIKDTSLQFVL